MKFSKNEAPPEPRLYLAAGKSLELLLAWIPKYGRYRDDISVLAAEVGADSERWYHDGNLRTTALIFEGKPPKGWVKGHMGCGHRPRARSKEMAPIRDRMRGDWEHSPRGDITKALLGSVPRDLILISDGGGRIRGYGYNLGWEKIGEDFVFKVDGLDEVPPPPDAIRLKRSEYWALKEALETTNTPAA